MKKLIVAISLIISFNAYSNEPYTIGTSDIVHLTGYNSRNPATSLSESEYFNVKNAVTEKLIRMYSKRFEDFTTTRYVITKDNFVFDTFDYIFYPEKDMHAFMYTASKEGSIPRVFTDNYGYPHYAVEKGSLKEYIWFFKFK